MFFLKFILHTNNVPVHFQNLTSISEDVSVTQGHGHVNSMTWVKKYFLCPMALNESNTQISEHPSGNEVMLMKV